MPWQSSWFSSISCTLFPASHTLPIPLHYIVTLCHRVSQRDLSHPSLAVLDITSSLQHTSTSSSMFPSFLFHYFITDNGIRSKFHQSCQASQLNVGHFIPLDLFHGPCLSTMHRTRIFTILTLLLSVPPLRLCYSRLF